MKQEGGGEEGEEGVGGHKRAITASPVEQHRILPG